MSADATRAPLGGDATLTAAGTPVGDATPTSGALRRGFTTGACAQAATAAAAARQAGGPEGSSRDAAPAGAAAHARDDTLSEVTVVLPGGETATFAVSFDADGVAWVTKDAGDDPDVTHGLVIGSRVERTPGVFAVAAGDGVGTVTLPGLAIEAGLPAINPAPRDAILGELRRALPDGAAATILAPGGDVLARKTLNPRLGIVGGISILGTTGRVEPWSVEALRDSLAPQLDVALARGRTGLVFVVGSKGRRLAVDAGADDADIIETANEVGWMLEQAAERGIGRVTVRGHVGKLVKLAAGVFDTHSRVADARLVTLAAYAGALGVPADEIRALLGMTTADLAATRLLELGRRDVLREVAAVGARAATQRYGIEVRIVLLDRDGNVLAQAVPRDAVTPSAGTATDAPADGGVS